MFVVDRALKVLAVILPPVRVDFSFVEFAFTATPTTHILGFIALGTTSARALVGAVFILLMAWAIRRDALFFRHSPALALIVLGGASNLYDRFAYGAVIDVFTARLGANLGVFNLADVMIVVGLVGLVSGRRVKLVIGN